VYADLSHGNTVPTIAYDGKRPIEYSFLPLTQYGMQNCRVCTSFGELLDIYFGERDRAALVSARASDLQRAVSSAEARLERKLEIQQSELAECDKGDECRRDADLIVANLYQLKKGDENVRLIDYSEMLEDGSFAMRTLRLDARLTPSANAQRLYKKYNKSCTARVELARQMKLAREELDYVRSVRGALSRAETGAELAQIRAELEGVGLLRARKGAAPAKSVKAPIAVYRTTNGYEVLCGKNNLQNEEITFRRAERGDIWFHAKGVPGSHVLLRTEGVPLDDIPDVDLNEALAIAAYNSDARGGNNVAVDYTDARHIKKPSAARPGLVIYHTNYTAYITPDAEKVASLRV
jgi:predicted ribosome quality control (RQC) complex YloA/Tae2 family protein